MASQLRAAGGDRAPTAATPTPRFSRRDSNTTSGGRGSPEQAQVRGTTLPPASACCLFRRCAPRPLPQGGCLRKHLYIYIYINMDTTKRGGRLLFSKRNGRLLLACLWVFLLGEKRKDDPTPCLGLARSPFSRDLQDQCGSVKQGHVCICCVSCLYFQAPAFQTGP